MLDNNDLLLIGKLLDEKLDEKLDPIIQRIIVIEEEIKEIRGILDRLDKRTDEDVRGLYKEIELLKKRILDLENKAQLLQVQH